MNRPDWTRDPVAPGLLLFGGMAVAGFVAIILGWRAAARTLIVGQQLPAIISGGMGGLALIAVGAGLFIIHLNRRFNAEEFAETDALLDEAHALVNATKAARS